MSKSRLKLTIFLILIVLTCSFAGSVSIAEGTIFSLNDLNSSITAGKDFEFSELTVYNDTVGFVGVNLSVRALDSSRLNASLNEFNTSTDNNTLIGLNFSSDSSKAEVNITGVSNLSELNSSGEKTVEGDTASFKFNLSESGGFEVTRSTSSGSDGDTNVTEDNETEDNSTDDSTDDDGDGSGSSGGGGSPSTGGSSGGGVTDDSQESSENNSETPEVKFGREKMSLTGVKSKEISRELELINSGNGVAEGQLTAESIPVESIRNNVEVEEDSTKSVPVTFKSEIVGNFSGSIRYEYQSENISLPINLAIKEREIDINSSISGENGSVSYKLNVSGTEEGEKVLTQIFGENDEAILNKTYTADSNFTTIEGGINKKLSTGNYKIVSSVKSNDSASVSTSKTFKLKKESDKNLYILIAVLTILLAALLVERILRGGDIEPNFEKQLTEIKKHVEDREDAN